MISGFTIEAWAQNSSISGLRLRRQHGYMWSGTGIVEVSSSLLMSLLAEYTDLDILSWQALGRDSTEAAQGDICIHTGRLQATSLAGSRNCNLPNQCHVQRPRPFANNANHQGSSIKTLHPRQIPYRTASITCIPASASNADDAAPFFSRVARHSGRPQRFQAGKTRKEREQRVQSFLSLAPVVFPIGNGALAALARVVAVSDSLVDGRRKTAFRNGVLVWLVCFFYYM